jgi:hypothetical protein
MTLGFAKREGFRFYIIDFNCTIIIQYQIEKHFKDAELI